MENKLQTRTITIREQQPVSWNKLYSAQHWAKRQEIVGWVRGRVRAELDPNQEPFTHPVRVTITNYFGDELLYQADDADNLCSKVYLDALKGWILVDDNPLFVTDVHTLCRLDVQDPRLEIVVEEQPDEVVTVQGLMFRCTLCKRKVQPVFTQLTHLIAHLKEQHPDKY